MREIVPSSNNAMMAVFDAVFLADSFSHKSRYSALFFDNALNSCSICCKLVRCATRIPLKLVAKSLIEFGNSSAMLISGRRFFKVFVRFVFTGNCLFSRQQLGEPKQKCFMRGNLSEMLGEKL